MREAHGTNRAYVASVRTAGTDHATTQCAWVAAVWSAATTASQHDRDAQGLRAQPGEHQANPLGRCAITQAIAGDSAQSMAGTKERRGDGAAPYGRRFGSP